MISRKLYLRRSKKNLNKKIIDIEPMHSSVFQKIQNNLKNTFRSLYM